ncbi:hypothetical protein ACFLSX_02770 [Calditrichota bacterium]
MYLKSFLIPIISFFLAGCYTQLQTVKMADYDTQANNEYEEEYYAEDDTIDTYAETDEYGNTYNFYLNDPYYNDYWDYGYYPGNVHISLGYGWGHYYPYRYYRPYRHNYGWYDDWCYYGYDNYYPYYNYGYYSPYWWNGGRPGYYSSTNYKKRTFTKRSSTVPNPRRNPIVRGSGSKDPGVQSGTAASRIVKRKNSKTQDKVDGKRKVTKRIVKRKSRDSADNKKVTKRNSNSTKSRKTYSTPQRSSSGNSSGRTVTRSAPSRGSSSSEGKSNTSRSSGNSGRTTKRR